MAQVNEAGSWRWDFTDCMAQMSALWRPNQVKRARRDFSSFQTSFFFSFFLKARLCIAIHKLWNTENEKPKAKSHIWHSNHATPTSMCYSALSFSQLHVKLKFHDWQPRYAFWPPEAAVDALDWGYDGERFFWGGYILLYCRRLLLSMPYPCMECSPPSYVKSFYGKKRHNVDTYSPLHVHTH